MQTKDTAAARKIAAAILKEERQRAGLSQVELSLRLQKPQSYVSKIESAEKRIEALELIEVANALGVKAAYLIDRIERNTKG